MCIQGNVGGGEQSHSIGSGLITRLSSHSLAGASSRSVSSRSEKSSPRSSRSPSLEMLKYGNL